MRVPFFIPYFTNGDEYDISYLTIRLRARVFYEQIVSEAQPINLLVVSLHKNVK